MHYFSNKFSKIAKRWDEAALFDFGGLKLRGLGKLCFFLTDYDDKFEL